MFSSMLLRKIRKLKFYGENHKQKGCRENNWKKYKL